MTPPAAAAEAEVRALCQRALAHHTLSVSDLIALFEDARDGAAPRLGPVVRLLAAGRAGAALLFRAGRSRAIISAARAGLHLPRRRSALSGCI